MDIKHFYIEKGQGDPVILLHGNGENCTYFKNQIETVIIRLVKINQSDNG